MLAVPVDALHPFYAGVQSYRDLPPILRDQTATSSSTTRIWRRGSGRSSAIRDSDHETRAWVFDGVPALHCSQTNMGWSRADRNTFSPEAPSADLGREPVGGVAGSWARWP